MYWYSSSGVPSNILREKNKLSNHIDYANLKELPKLSQISAARLSLPYSNVRTDRLSAF